MVRLAIIFVTSLVFGTAMAQETYSVEEELRDAGLEWTLPLATCSSDALPTEWVSISYDRRACEDHLAACVANCEQGDASQCYIAAQTHQRLENDVHAEALFQQACQFGSASGCTNFASTRRAEGTGNDQCIADTFFASCAGNDLWGCTMSGVVLWYGEGIEADRERARKYFDRSCTLNPDYASCDLAKEIIAEADEEGDL